MEDSRESSGQHNGSAVPRPSASEEEVARLVRLARQGSQEAFAKLVEIFRAPIVNLAYQIVGSRADAEDVAQDALINAFRSLDSYREESKFFSWLYRIVTNAAIDLVRRRRALPTVSREDLDAWVADEEAPETTALRITVWLALERLPPLQRAVLVLRDWHGLSYAQIAETLGITPGMVGARIRAARQHLQRALGQEEHAGGSGARGPRARRPTRRGE
jgi:RNA polymerase sigma-70 factor (ECF subfamily)